MPSLLLLRDISSPLTRFIGAFVFILSIGYFTGLLFVAQTESTTPSGIVENYNGNETVENPKVLKFKKGKREMLTIIHTHILSIGFIFAFMGLLVWGTQIKTSWKLFLTIEPFVSLVVTFGGIYLLWLGYGFMAYLVVISGILMTLSFLLGVFFVLQALAKTPTVK